MASIGHIAIGMAGARFMRRRGGSRRTFVATTIAFSALSMLPDADVVGFALRVPYGAPWGHRGATHSLVMAACVGLAVGMGAFARMSRRGNDCLVRAARLGCYSALVVASHGLVDALTDGGKGVALLWPFTTERFFFPFRPIPVAPIGVAFLSARGMRVAAVELLQFAPFFAYALWPRRQPLTGDGG